jgi:hypothetical protein
VNVSQKKVLCFNKVIFENVWALLLGFENGPDFPHWFWCILCVQWLWANHFLQESCCMPLLLYSESLGGFFFGRVGGLDWTKKAALASGTRVWWTSCFWQVWFSTSCKIFSWWDNHLFLHVGVILTRVGWVVDGWCRVFMISSLTGNGVEDLEAYLMDQVGCTSLQQSS